MDNKSIIYFLNQVFFFELILSYLFDKEMKVTEKVTVISEIFKIRTYTEFDFSPFNLSSAIKKLKPIINLIYFIEGYIVLASVTDKRYICNKKRVCSIINKTVNEAKITELNVRNTQISIDILNDTLSLAYIPDNEIDELLDIYYQGSLLVFKDYFDFIKKVW